MSHVDSASDERTANNDVRHQYRVLSEKEKTAMIHIKDMGQATLNAIRDCVPEGREAALARTNIEQGIMWAVKGLTG